MDGEIKQKANTKLMINSFNYIIAYISKFITLNKGDLIFTGTPEGVGPIQIGNILVACIEDKKMLQVKIK